LAENILSYFKWKHCIEVQFNGRIGAESFEEVCHTFCGLLDLIEVSSSEESQHLSEQSLPSS